MQRYMIITGLAESTKSTNILGREGLRVLRQHGRYDTARDIEEGEKKYLYGE